MKFKYITFLALIFSGTTQASFDCQPPPNFGEKSYKTQIIDFILTQIGVTTILTQGDWCLVQ